MSINPSNMYAEKIFSEHPIALWALDDKVDYISLIDITNKDLTSWNIDEGTLSEETSISTQPFVNENLYKLTGSPSTTETITSTLVSEDVLNFTEFSNAMPTFCISSYFYTNSTHLASIAIGFRYTDVNTAQEVEVLETVPISITDKWFLISKTFSKINQNTTFKIVIKISYFQSTDPSSEYEFFLNGINVGQNSEEFNNYSMGCELINLPSEIALETSSAIIARSYGSEFKYGYYLANNNRVYCKNFGVPLVYGASNTTRLYPNIEDEITKPSIIFPGFGFLNDYGRYNTYTFEMWVRFLVDTTENKKIFGPISSTDGLYVDDCFLTLLIGGKYKSVFIEEWGTPMLIQIVYLENKINLYLNGEKVIDMSIDNSTIDLPNKYNEEDKDQDWLGFYTYSNINPFEIDCVAIYPYAVPEIVSKKRWTYGQAVKSYESLDSSYSGKSAFIDYSFSSYGLNYKYPNIGKWNQGKIDNLVATNNSLSTPEYSLPIINLENTDLQSWYNLCSNVQSLDYNFVSFTPNEETSINGYFLFDNFNILNDKIRSLFSIISIKETPVEEQVIMIIKNKINSDYLSISVDSSSIKYKISVNNVLTTIKEVDYTLNSILNVGFDIKTLISTYGKQFSTFFGNTGLLKIIFFNNEELEKCFVGNIFALCFSTSNNFQEISVHFNDDGIVKENALLINHNASYKLSPIVKYEDFHLDIGVSGYWEDYIPLKYFGKYVTDSNGKKIYDLNSIQYNIGYPSPSIFKEIEDSSGWTYGQLNEKFSIPIQQTYEILDNSLFTGYNIYEDLQYNRSDLFYEYDSSNSLVKSYISFQFVTNKINKKFNSFTTIAPALKNNLLNLNNYSDWQNTLFLVENDTIIYPPNSVSFEDLAIVVHLQFSTKSTIDRKISIKNLELSSRSLNKDSFTPISTGSGMKLYPYIKNGVYYDFNGKNPFSVYKKSNPYLYLGRYSGIKLKGDFNSYQNRGISMLINENKESLYSVATVQLSFKNEDENFTYTPTEIFEIQNVENTIKFYIVANESDPKRGKIYAINSKTGTLENGISYYLNGQLVSNLVVDNKTWNFIGISFGTPLKFNSFTGSININGPYVYNHISYYKLTGLQQKQSSINRLWDEVKEQYIFGNEDPYEFDWDFWNIGYLWYGVFVKTSVSNFGEAPANIYKSYMGTNKIIAGNDGEKTLLVKSDGNTVHIGSSWKQYISTPT